jgi:7-cyano-7-deazaguanine synthase
MSDQLPGAGRRAVVLLSGGLDSATVLAVARAQGFTVHALSFRYGQRHEHELAAAARVAQAHGAAAHAIINIDLAAIGGSALTDASIAVPKDRGADAMAHGIPVTYVPARNTIFLSMALGLAEVIDAQDIFIGVNALDYSGYPDCRPAFVEAFEHLANVATAASTDGGKRMHIRAPLLQLTKREIIQLGLLHGVDYRMTSSCYDPAADGAACGHCDACQLRHKGFRDAGITDPTVYAVPPAELA